MTIKNKDKIREEIEKFEDEIKRCGATEYNICCHSCEKLREKVKKLKEKLK